MVEVCRWVCQFVALCVCVCGGCDIGLCSCTRYRFVFMAATLQHWGRHDPGSVPIVPGERFHGPFGVATAGVALGMTVVLSNRRARTHCHLLPPARDRI